MLVFSRILVPLDHSGASAAALALVRTNFPGGKLRLLHVLDPSQLAGAITSTVSPDAQREEVEQRAAARLAHLRVEADEFVIRVGKPAEVIVTEAEQWQADLIAMGTHGRTGFDHFLHGSVAEHVVRRSRLPVLIEHENTANDNSARV